VSTPDEEVETCRLRSRTPKTHYVRAGKFTNGEVVREKRPGRPWCNADYNRRGDIVEMIEPMPTSEDPRDVNCGMCLRMIEGWRPVRCDESFARAHTPVHHRKKSRST
jgi:hypothetical protein